MLESFAVVLAVTAMLAAIFTVLAIIADIIWPWLERREQGYRPAATYRRSNQ